MNMADIRNDPATTLVSCLAVYPTGQRWTQAHHLDGQCYEGYLPGYQTAVPLDAVEIVHDDGKRAGEAMDAERQSERAYLAGLNMAERDELGI